VTTAIASPLNMPTAPALSTGGLTVEAGERGIVFQNGEFHQAVLPVHHAAAVLAFIEKNFAKLKTARAKTLKLDDVFSVTTNRRGFVLQMNADEWFGTDDVLLYRADCDEVVEFLRTFIRTNSTTLNYADRSIPSKLPLPPIEVIIAEGLGRVWDRFECWSREPEDAVPWGDYGGRKRLRRPGWRASVKRAVIGMFIAAISLPLIFSFFFGTIYFLVFLYLHGKGADRTSSRITAFIAQAIPFVIFVVLPMPSKHYH
jgi:hypothetical protein